MKQNMYVAIAVLTALVLCHVMNQLGRIFKKSRAAGNAKKLTENLILQNIFVKMWAVVAYFHSIILACFHQP